MEKKRILILGNKKLDTSSVAGCLKEAGYHPRFVFSKKQAWSALTKQPKAYNVVMVDSVATMRDDLDLLTKIKASPKLCDIPVIIETNRGNTDKYLASLEAGAFDFIYKPIDDNFLLHVINNATKSRLMS